MKVRLLNRGTRLCERLLVHHAGPVQSVVNRQRRVQNVPILLKECLRVVSGQASAFPDIRDGISLTCSPLLFAPALLLLENLQLDLATRTTRHTAVLLQVVVVDLYVVLRLRHFRLPVYASVTPRSAQRAAVRGSMEHMSYVMAAAALARNGRPGIETLGDDRRRYDADMDACRAGGASTKRA